MPVTLFDATTNATIEAYIKQADDVLATMGYTEHGMRHITLVARQARQILQCLGASDRDQELAAIAAHMHDIGNGINRHAHAQTGSMMAFSLLSNLDMDPLEISTVCAAIGNHDEHVGIPVSAVSAAVILADKTDVHKSRVRRPAKREGDIHDRVNSSVTRCNLNILPAERVIRLELEVDATIASPMEYFEIFTGRMNMCRKAAQFLGSRFQLEINRALLLA